MLQSTIGSVKHKQPRFAPCSTPNSSCFPVQRYHHRLEKQQLAETARGQLARANARLRNLQTQHERLQLRENERNAQAIAPVRPSTCPTLPSAGEAPEGRRSERLRTVSDAPRTLSRGGAESECAMSKDKRANETRNAVGKPCVRVVWGAGVATNQSRR